MSFRISFFILLFSISFNSCYLKALKASRRDNAIVQKKCDSLVKQNAAVETELNDFRLKYVRFPTGAGFSHDTVIEKADKYQLSGLANKQNVLYNPVNLSMWGNDLHGDCVTAEEAFAKACNDQEIFIPEQVAVGWASENGVLEGAYLPDVLYKMKDVGFRTNGMTFNDGKYSYVDFRNSTLLQNAISSGPVKIGITATQLNTAYRYNRRGWFAVGFTPETVTKDNKHCVSLCGYGTLAWLAQQFHVPLPNGVNGQNIGYALFTWGTIGIIDEPSLLAITHEAWIRTPTTVQNNNVSSFILKAMGGEQGYDLSLSHADGNIQLLKTFPGGFGEMWICHDLGGGKIKLQVRGAEDMFIVYLSHAFGKLDLRGSYDGATGEEWIVHDLGNGEIALEAAGAEKGLFLSHAFRKLDLRPNMQGGEAWKNTGQH